MALIICLDSTSKNCSVALSENGVCFDLIEHEEEAYSHAENLSEFIDQILIRNKKSYSNLDAVCISGGPGSYTGLRIGTSTAKGMCYALDIPLIALDTLKVMTSHMLIKDIDIYVPMVDARRMEVFYSSFDSSLNCLHEAGPLILDEYTFQKEIEENTMLFFGSGAEKFAGILKHSNAQFKLDYKNSAKHLCSLAEKAFTKKDFADLAYYEPSYLKPFVATVPKKKMG